MFVFGINSALRISDILPQRVWDVRGKTHHRVKEKKTGKTRRILMTEGLRSEVAKYIQGKADSDWLFPSRKGDQPITRQRAWDILNRAAREVGIDGLIGTHTLRKTFGYHFYYFHPVYHHDVAMLQKMFGHSSPSYTLRYIGVDDAMIDAAYEDFYL